MIFKAYDIRGIYGEELTEEKARLIGGGLVEYLGADRIVIGRDMRTSGNHLFNSLAEGITEAGATAVDIGLVSTDALYFAVGKYDFPCGVMITASHNPGEYNGFKICREGARPLSGSDGLPQIREIVERGSFKPAPRQGELEKMDIMDDFRDFVLSFVDTSVFKPFKIAVDAGNGMAGKIVPEVFGNLPVEIVPLYFELDGHFPNHLANPIELKNTEALRKLVKEDDTIDFGAAFDGDADRLFLVDGNGKLVDSSLTAAMVAKAILEKNPGSTITHNIICSKTVRQTIEQNGGKPVLTPVGHAIIKPIMREKNAIFGGEHSGHFYFRDFWFADSAVLTFMYVIELLSKAGKNLDEILSEMDTYVRSGEINTRVDDREQTLEKIKKTFTTDKVKPILLDGVTFDFGDYWFNVRPSNTEPLIRLNLEANSQELMEKKRDEVLGIIRS